MIDKRYIEALADSFRDQKPIGLSEIGRGQVAQWRSDVEAAAYALEAYDTGFDRDSFYARCDREPLPPTIEYLQLLLFEEGQSP